MKHIISYEELVRIDMSRFNFARRHVEETGLVANEIDLEPMPVWWPAKAEYTYFGWGNWHRHEVRIDHKGQELFIKEGQSVVYDSEFNIFWIRDSKSAEKQKTRFMRLLKKYDFSPQMVQFSTDMTYKHIVSEYCFGYGDSFSIVNKDCFIVYDFALIPSGEEEIVKVILHDNGVWLDRTYRKLENFLKRFKK